MRLEPATTPPVDDPTSQQIAEALADESNEFVILMHDDGKHYMQAAPAEGGYVVEYCRDEEAADTYSPDRSPKQWQRHYQAVEPQSLEQATSLLAAYAVRDESFRTATEWRDITSEIHGVDRRGGMVVLLIIVFLAALALYLYFTR